MDGWLLAGLVYQVLNALWLAFLLGSLYYRERHHAYLLYWALAWASLGIVIAGTAPLRLADAEAGRGLVAMAIVAGAVGLTEPVFLAMAALSLGGRRFSRPMRVGIPAAVVVLSIVLFAVVLNVAPVRVGFSSMVRAVRSGATAATAWWFALAFLRLHPGAASFGGRLTAVFTALYGMNSAGISAAAFGASLSGTAITPIPTWIVSMLALGITSGMLLLLIQEKEAAARAVDASARRYRTLVETSPDAITMTDGQGRLQLANRQAAAMFAFDQPADMVGLPLLDLIDPSSSEPVARGLDRARGGGTAALGEQRFRHRDGTTFPGELTVVPMTGDEGIASGAIARIVDITARKTAEEEKARLEERLAQSERLESIGRLAGGVAHDFNNLLTLINGYGSLLVDGLPSGSPQQASAREVCAAGHRAADLTRQLLAFSRRQALEPRVISLNTVIAGEQGLLRRLLPETIDFVVRLDDAVGTVLADRSQLSQVLMNLVLNARDAVEGRGHIMVETSAVDWGAEGLAERPQMKPGRYAMLAVTDNGHGMDDKTRQQVFEPFFTTKAQGRGTGLGLATVYGIVRQSGGWIWVYSEPGKGTTFKIYLPEVEGTATEVRPAEAQAPARHAGTGTILVVEDQAEVRQLTVTALAECGYTVLAAGDGEEALAVAARTEGPIDLVLTDVVMPGMSGREMATRLAASRPQARVLYTSGYTSNVIVHEGVLDPDVEYLPKPFTPHQLAERVRAVLGG